MMSATDLQQKFQTMDDDIIDLESNPKDVAKRDTKSLESELIAIDKEIQDLSQKIRKYEEKRRALKRRAEVIREQIQQKESDALLEQDWERRQFEWTDRLNIARQEIFNLSSYRPDQLAVINASMSGHDCILIMPTGGGKSLTYQLPAVISSGITLVVSPLLSLMEDQVMALQRLGVGAEMLTANSEQETKKRVMKEMLDSNSRMKLLYVTPEKCSKSKQFMAKLQKMHQAGRFVRLAIDEVHCCSQWGHDFRPDYKFLGAMRTMFPDVPILGLTATSTAAVTKDVKDILRIPSAMVFTAGFNRPNLHYSVRIKPEAAEDNFDMLANLVKTEFRDMTGIIYSTTVKEVDTLYAELKKRGIKAGPYHAQMETTSRSRVHRMWSSGDIKVVVATVAFGMGIDKPDVRFVIHNTISRSMENFYQESGRAGRDGEKATCIMLWRLGDVFKQSTMVFQERTGMEKLYSMVNYCLSTNTCRRKLIAEHFLESMERNIECNEMCDICEQGGADTQETVDVTDYAKAAVDILNAGVSKETRITAIKLVEALQGRGANNIKIARWKGGQCSKEQVEQIVAMLLVEQYLVEDMHYTPYNVISYILPGPRTVSKVNIRFMTSQEKKSKKRKKKSSGDSEDDFKDTKKANFDIVISSDDE